MQILALGHKNPDTDATVSPIILAAILQITEQKDIIPVIQDKPNKEALYVLDRFEVQVPKTLQNIGPDTQVYIVDTTNPDELPENIQEATILGIFDHHKLAGLKTNKPLLVHVRPLGSTSTVLLDYFTSLGYKLNQLPDNILKLALAGIISDTLNLTSPTTTQKDKYFYEKLVELTKIDPNNLANAMFQAKSDISDLSDLDIITYDAKVYEFSKGKVHIGVFETVNVTPVLQRHKTLAKALKEFRRQNGFFQVFLFVIDIIRKQAYFIKYCKRAESYIKKAFADAIVEETDTYIKLKDIVSRKKQIVPPLEKIL